TVKNGKVSATLTMISLDLDTRSLIVSRNGHVPVLIFKGQEELSLDNKTNPIGVHRFMKPEINQLEIGDNMTILAFTDGFIEAGDKYNQQLDMDQVWQIMKQDLTAKEKAEELFKIAMKLDQNRPGDDTSVIVATIKSEEDGVPISTLNLSIPF
ncbi:MAG: SpoIIE family protein phosphatase, partial [Bacillota bacterium]|nr:SpoIIE family protein phosphatase [Bacillota bacterium]